MSEPAIAQAKTDREISVVRKIASRTLVSSTRRMSPVPALKVALPKAAELALNMALQVIEVKEGLLSAKAMYEAIPEDALVTLLSAKDGARGLVGVDAQLLSALIEVQTTGQVRATQGPTRIWTLTDGQMCEPFVDRVFDVLEGLLNADGRGPWFYGYRFNSKVNDRRKLSMTLDDARYLFYACKVDLGEGAKTGMFWLALPDNVRNSGADGSASPEKDDWQNGLQSSVLRSEAKLNAVLYRLQIPLGTYLQLKKGDLLKLPGRALDRVRLEGAEGKAVAIAALGQAKGQRAVRLTGNVEQTQSGAQYAALNANRAGDSGVVPPVLPGAEDISGARVNPAPVIQNGRELSSTAEFAASGAGAGAGMSKTVSAEDVPDYSQPPGLPHT